MSTWQNQQAFENGLLVSSAEVPWDALKKFVATLIDSQPGKIYAIVGRS